MADFGSRFVGLSARIEAERRQLAADGEARRLIQLVKVNGGTIEAADGRIRVKGYKPDAPTVEQLKRAKPELLTILRGEAR